MLLRFDLVNCELDLEISLHLQEYIIEVKDNSSGYGLAEGHQQWNMAGTGGCIFG